MANTIKIKRKTTTGAPSIGSLTDGEMCLVVPDLTLYLRVDSSNLVKYLPMQPITQAAYDALSPPNDNIFYMITDA